MEELYTLGLEIHIVGLIILMAVVMFNILMLALSKHILVYAKRMRVVMPISASFIFLVLFTGIIMMAAKHLQFTFSNIVMIIGALAMIVLEVKRYKTLKYKTDIHNENALEKYKHRAFRYLGIEMGILIFLTTWMMS